MEMATEMGGEGLLLGVDLCDDYSQISCFRKGENQTEPVILGEEADSPLIPTVICKKKGQDEWLIGEEAYRLALLGGGTTVDKLVKLVRRSGSATIEGVRYTAEELLEKFLKLLLAVPRSKYNNPNIENLVITVQELELGFNDSLIRAAENCGVSRSRIHVLSHTEAFVYYVVSQPKDIWANQVSMFDLTEDGLHYYEMRVIRGRRPQVIEAAHRELEEGFSLDVLETPSGERLADTILTACAERLFQKRLISAVFLTGKGFASTDWATDFLKYLCSKKRAFAGQQLFAAGAAYVAHDNILADSEYPFVLSCEGRLRSTVSLFAVCDGRREQLVLASAGRNWYEEKCSLELIPDDIGQLDLTLTPVDQPRIEKISIPLDELPARPNKTTRIRLSLAFTAEDCMSVWIEDEGFGDLFPSTHRVIRKDFRI